MSLFSAAARPPGPGDLAGLLCGPGDVELFGRGSAARVTVALDRPWRAVALRTELAERGIAGRSVHVERGAEGVLLRTAFRADLAALGMAWCAGRGKEVPAGFRLDGGALRLWALAAGAHAERGYRLTLDPGAPATHEPVADALRAAGMDTRPVRQRDGRPALLLHGRKRLERFTELIGELPATGEHAQVAN